MSEICIIATIVVYLAAMLLVGFAYSKTNNDSADFYLGGRKMGPLVTAMSAEASDMSSWLLMGMPGLAYLTGIASPGWTAIGLALGTWLNWLIVARLTIICVSVVLARDPDSSVFGIVSFAWAGFGGSFGAVVLCALFWKRCNWQGALAGMLSGGLMVFVWKYLVSPLGGVFGIYELLPAFLVSLAVCVVVSLVTPAPGAKIEAEFEAAK